MGWGVAPWQVWVRVLRLLLQNVFSLLVQFFLLLLIRLRIFGVVHWNSFHTWTPHIEKCVVLDDHGFTGMLNAVIATRSHAHVPRERNLEQALDRISAALAMPARPLLNG
jgi:hypothetical protein